MTSIFTNFNNYMKWDQHKIFHYIFPATFQVFTVHVLITICDLLIKLLVR